MKKKLLSRALGSAFKILCFVFALLGIVMTVLIFAFPSAMEIGIQGLSINAGEVSLDDRIILACFVVVTIFLAVISANYISSAFKAASDEKTHIEKIKLVENGGYIVLAWAVFSIGEKASLPFFNILVESDRIVIPYYGESIILLMTGFFIVITAMMFQDRD